MPYYRFFFTDCQKSIVGHSVVELGDDASAQSYADKLLAGSVYVGIEVWDRARLFYRKTKNRDCEGWPMEPHPRFGDAFAPSVRPNAEATDAFGARLPARHDSLRVKSMSMRNQVSDAFSNAARRILKAFGREEVAEIVRRSTAIIYKWSDASLDYYPNLQQALELDAAFVTRGLGAPSFLTGYSNLLKHRVAGSRQADAEMLPAAIEIVNLACKIVAEISAHMADSTVDGEAHALQLRNICRDLHELGELQAASTWSLKRQA